MSRCTDRFNLHQVRVKGEKRSEELNLLVDARSIFTWISGQTLVKLVVKPTSSRRFRTIECREIRRRAGEAVLELMSERATRVVVFAEEGDSSVLGTNTLEGLGFEVDPTTKQLKKIWAFIAY